MESNLSNLCLANCDPWSSDSAPSTPEYSSPQTWSVDTSAPRENLETPAKAVGFDRKSFCSQSVVESKSEFQDLTENMNDLSIHLKKVREDIIIIKEQYNAKLSELVRLTSLEHEHAVNKMQNIILQEETPNNLNFIQSYYNHERPYYKNINNYNLPAQYDQSLISSNIEDVKKKIPLEFEVETSNNEVQLQDNFNKDHWNASLALQEPLQKDPTELMFPSSQDLVGSADTPENVQSDERVANPLLFAPSQPKPDDYTAYYSRMLQEAQLSYDKIPKTADMKHYGSMNSSLETRVRARSLDEVMAEFRANGRESPSPVCRHLPKHLSYPPLSPKKDLSEMLRQMILYQQQSLGIYPGHVTTADRTWSAINNMRKKKVTISECVFCRNNGEHASIFRSHTIRSADGRVTCPVLRSFSCPTCGATGDNAHTLKYCPQVKQEYPSLAQLQKNLNMANGKKRATSFKW